jgi:group I intron endonuclease
MVFNILNEFKEKSGIYVIRPMDLTDNRRYFGMAKVLRNRFDGHRSKIRGNKHDNIHLQNFYNKYGDKSLIFEMVESYDFYNREFLISREQIYLDLMFKENVYTPFNIHQISCCREGVPLTQEQKKKLSDSNRGRKGKPLTTDAKIFLSKKFGRAIQVLKKDGTFLKEFSSSLEASLELKIPNKLIKDILYRKTQNKTDYNFIFTEDKKVERKTRGDICQYDKNGRFLKKFASLLDAAHSLETGECDVIFQACREHNRRPWLGFYWRFDDSESPKDLNQEDINWPRAKNRNSKRVSQVDKRGNILGVYESPPEAARVTGLDRRNIQKACNGGTGYSGFKWYYTE